MPAERAISGSERNIACKLVEKSGFGGEEYVKKLYCRQQIVRKAANNVALQKRKETLRLRKNRR
jgi:hypothetical protein